MDHRVDALAFARAAAAASWYRIDGKLAVGVVVKATFALQQARDALPVEAEAIVSKDRYFERTPTRSLEAAADAAPFKPHGEVLLRGHAHSPGGVPRPTAAARLAVRGAEARVDRTIHVYGDRDGPTGKPRPFQRMALVYERAVGGPGTDNPVGRPLDDPRPPNLVDPLDASRPACFAPVSPYWLGRKRLLPATLRRRVDRSVPDLPGEFDYDYYLVAPEEQRTSFFRGDEWLVLDGMHPALPRVQTRLPQARAVARILRVGRPAADVALVLDTLLVDADRLTATVVFRGLVPDFADSEVGAVTVVAGAFAGDEPVVWPEVAPPQAANARPTMATDIDTGEDALTATMSLTGDEREAAGMLRATPFAPTATAPSAPPPPPGPGPGEEPDFGEVTGFFDPRAALPAAATPFAPVRVAPGAPQPPAQPFGPGSLAPTPPPTSRPPVGPAPAAAPSIDDEETSLDDAVARQPPLPFRSPPRTSPGAQPVTPHVPTPPPQHGTTPGWVAPPATALRPEVSQQQGAPPDWVASPANLPRLAPPPIPGSPWARDAARSSPSSVPPAAETLPGAMPASTPPFVARFGPPTAVDPPEPAAEPAAAGAERPRTSRPPARDGAAPPAPPARGDKPDVPIVTATPLLVVTLPWQVKPPRDSLTIVVKGTFDLVADEPAVLQADGTFPIGDLHLDDDPEKGLVYGSDLAILKPRADVTLSGTAHAPAAARGGTEAMQVEFRFGAGARGFVRRAAVIGDRRWQRLAPSAPERFETMPLTWERAFGGPAFDRNPVGAGHKARTGADGVARLPNVEDPAHLVTSPGDSPEPACFAAVGMQWKERWSKLGTYDKRWFKTRWPYYPEDFDWGFFQVAPASQQLPYLRGDERFSLVGLRPDTPRFDGRLPGLRVRCFIQNTAAAGGSFREIDLVLDTAHFDTDRLALFLVWRAVVDVSEEEAPEIDAIFVTHEPLTTSPMSLDEAKTAYLTAATPPPPEETAPEDAPPSAPKPSPDAEPPEETLEEARARVRQELAAAGVPMPPGVEGDPPAPPPPPDPAAVAAMLRESGASEEDIAEVVEALTPPPADEAEQEAAADPRAQVIELLANGEPLDELDLAGANLCDLDFSNRSLCDTVLKGASLCRASFAGAKLEGANLARADLAEAQFVGADLTGADFAGALASRADFSRATLEGTDFSAADLAGAIFDESSGASPQFEGAILDGARFSGARIEDADFSGAHLEQAVFDHATLPQMRLYRATATGASFVGATIPGARADSAKLARAKLVGVVAPGSVWERAILDGATFHGAKLEGASFARASCRKAIFSTADLREARMRRANLSGAAFLESNLMAATLERADLSGADLRGANLHAAETWHAKLDDAKLDQAIVTQTKLEGR